MKKLVAAFMAALMMVAVLAAPVGAVASTTSMYKEYGNKVTTRHISIKDAELKGFEGGDNRRYDACFVAGGIAAVGIFTGGLTFGVSLVVSAFLIAEPCARAAFGH